MVIEEGLDAREKKILKFHEAFLAGIRSGGRINEPMMIARYKMTTGDLFSDLKLGLDMFMKGKLSLISPKTKDMSSVRKIFDRTKKG